MLTQASLAPLAAHSTSAHLGVGGQPLEAYPSLTMVDAFAGTWKLVDSKNFYDYMRFCYQAGDRYDQAYHNH